MFNILPPEISRKMYGFLNSRHPTPMLCIIALLLLMTESKSPCKDCSHLRKAFLPAQVLFHWKIWGLSEGNHSSAIGRGELHLVKLFHKSYHLLHICNQKRWLLFSFIKVQLVLDITGSSVSVCHPVWPADLGSVVCVWQQVQTGSQAGVQCAHRGGADKLKQVQNS